MACSVIMTIVVCSLGFGRRHIPDGLQQPTIIRPVDPVEGRVFDRFPVLHGPNDGSVPPCQADDRLGERLSYGSPTLPTEGSTPASASRSE